ncbi:MAG: hypothetical protein TRG1_2493 [Flavobacteriaceae bacterium FS1-H7996/R]|nr:MAG: hypothetical protein TRG1_2493 [Flavobacteriaceae bacterium FS1-H7996/R]
MSLSEAELLSSNENIFSFEDKSSRYTKVEMLLKTIFPMSLILVYLERSRKAQTDI